MREPLFTLQDVLDRRGITARDVNVMLHSPKEPLLQRILPSLVRTDREAMEVYQATHSPPAEAALKAGRPWVMAFVKVGQDVPSSHSRMLFAGLYRNVGRRLRSHADIAAEPKGIVLRDSYGIEWYDPSDPDRMHTWFDLTLDGAMEDLLGRLVISVALTPTYVRRAENVEAEVRAIHEESAFDADPPDWRSWVVTAAEMKALPPGWAARLREWRGIYLIRDASKGRPMSARRAARRTCSGDGGPTPRASSA